MKKTTFVLMAAMLVCALFAGCAVTSAPAATTAPAGTSAAPAATTAPANAKTYNFTLANHLSPTTVQNISFEEFIKDVDNKTNGQIKITLSPSATLGGQREIIEGVNLGTIEMGLGESAIYANYVPEFGVVTLPFMYGSADAFHRVFDGDIGKKLAGKLEETTNLKIISWLDGGVRDVYSKKKLENLADLKGLKIRTPESPVFISTFQAFGANPTPIPANEMYSSIQTDVVSAMEGTGEVAYTFKIHEVADYCLETGHIYTDISLTINKQLFASLPADLQATLLECGKTLTGKERALWAEKSGAYKQKMIDEKGMKYATVDKAQAQAAVASVYTDFIAGDAAKQEIYDMIIAAQK